MIVANDYAESTNFVETVSTATISSYHDIVAARSAVGRSPSPVRYGLERAA